MVNRWLAVPDGAFGGRACAGMDGLNYWIPRPSFQTRLYHGSAELAERPASMQAVLRRAAPGLLGVWNKPPRHPGGAPRINF